MKKRKMCPKRARRRVLVVGTKKNLTLKKGKQQNAPPAIVPQTVWGKNATLKGAKGGRTSSSLGKKGLARK